MNPENHEKSTREKISEFYHENKLEIDGAWEIEKFEQDFDQDLDFDTWLKNLWHESMNEFLERS